MEPSRVRDTSGKFNCSLPYDYCLTEAVIEWLSSSLVSRYTLPHVGCFPVDSCGGVYRLPEILLNWLELNV